MPPQEFKLIAHSKDGNSVALISVDGKQKIIKNRDDFIKEVQKVEKKLIKKQQKQDRYESISMVTVIRMLNLDFLDFHKQIEIFFVLLCARLVVILAPRNSKQLTEWVVE